MSRILTVSLFTLLLAGSAFAAEIRSAHYDSRTGKIVANVVYGGGCKEHHFKLKFFGYCTRPIPSEASAKLMDETKDDFCEAIVSRDVELDVSGLGPCRPALLTIEGDPSFEGPSDRPSSVEVEVPAKE